VESAELDYYEKVSKQYHALHTQPIQKYHTKIEFRLIRPHLAPGQRVLVVGCGGGRELEYFIEVEAIVVGVDFSRGMLNQAREKIRSLKPNIENDTVLHLSLVQADAINLPFEDSAFDMVLCLSTLNYIPNYEHAIKEMHRVLKPQGKLIITVINRLELAQLLRQACRYIKPWTGSPSLVKRSTRVFRKTFTLNEMRNILRRNNIQILRTHGLRLFIDLIPHRWNTQPKHFPKANWVIRCFGWLDNLLLQSRLCVQFARFIFLVGEKRHNE